MHLLTWIGVVAIVLASLVFLLSAVVGLAQRFVLARARMRRALGAHPFRDAERGEPSARGPALVWPSLGLLAIAATSLALAPRAIPPMLTPDEIARACASADTPPVLMPPSSGLFAFQHGTIENGRTSTIRTSMPVAGLDVVHDGGGFSATILGTLALDRAGPIAAANPDVERASVVNHGDHAVLVVRWVIDRSPPFRVAVRGQAIEVTVGR
jgi:hypothetical protein